ncbi:MAG: UDP-N-acetylmuramate--L-alanine ligase [Ornithinimicrobium sp.]
MRLPEPAAGRSRFDFGAKVARAADLGRVHFVAIGGAGVSSVALAYLQAGNIVTGSDQRDSPTLNLLRQGGAEVFVGHDASHLTDADTVIISGAVPETNPEVAAARRRGIPVLHRAQGIAALGRDRDLVAVAGANGKTTTSAMVVAALAAGGRDPGYVIGSPLVATGSSAALGSGPMVIEADESDGSFVAYRPRVGIVTNVMADHLDFFGTFAGVQSAFRAFVDSVDLDGLLLANADDEGALALARYAATRRSTLTWGQSTEADVRLSDVQQSGAHVEATLVWPAAERLGERASAGLERCGNEVSTSLSVPMPGLHNMQNAAGAVVAAVAGYGVRPEDASAGLADFGGTRRRFELIGEAGGVRVIDDYAHNPAKVAAVVRAGRAAAKNQGRVVVAFQPHLYSRTRDFAADFAEGLRDADVVMVLDVYGAREEPIAGVGAHTIVDLLRSPTILGSVPLHEAAAILAEELRPGDVMLTVGAGDITTLAAAILRRLQQGRARG